MKSLPAWPIIQFRRSPQRFLKAIAEGQLSIGFLGGSITDGANESNWPEPVTRWLLQRFPDVRLRIENAAIGATGSDSACVRARHEIIERGCDLTFVEYVVNDYGHPSERRGRSREGLIRQLLAAGQDVVLVYTYCPEMREDIERGEIPPSVAEFEALAAHYALGSVWSGLHALRAVAAGALTLEEWLPDGLHPSPQGSQLYADVVIQFLEQTTRNLESESLETPESRLPKALDAAHWQHIESFSLSSIEADANWLLRRVHTLYHVEQVLETQSGGAELSFDFQGRGLLPLCDFGHNSADFQFRFDQGPWQFAERERPSWCGARGLVRAFLAADDLEAGRPSFRASGFALSRRTRCENRVSIGADRNYWRGCLAIGSFLARV
jgi:lysophospholipase L1-like esterase